MLLSETITLPVSRCMKFSWSYWSIRISEYQSPESRDIKVQVEWEVRFQTKWMRQKRWCGLSLCAVPSQLFFISISEGQSDRDSWQVKGRRLKSRCKVDSSWGSRANSSWRGRDVQVIFELLKYKLYKLWFKYSEFVVQGVLEFWMAVAKLCKSPVKHTVCIHKEITGWRWLCLVPVECCYGYRIFVNIFSMSFSFIYK